MHSLILLAVTAFAAASGPKEVLREKMEQEVRRIAEGVDGVLGLAIVDLETGESFAIQGDSVFTQASAIKLPVLIELFRQAEEGLLSLDEKVTLSAAAVVPGSGVLQQLTPGEVTMTLRDVATLMVTVSDNTATNIVIDRVGMARVNETMTRLGQTHTQLQRKMMDARAWEENRENLSTPNEQAALLEALYRGTVLSEESRKEIVRILSIPKPGSIRELLPPGTRIAHKTGSLDGVAVDVGIVYLDDRPFIVSAMGNWLEDEAACERAIAEISLVAYRYFDRLAHSNAFGHRK